MREDVHRGDKNSQVCMRLTEVRENHFFFSRSTAACRNTHPPSPLHLHVLVRPQVKSTWPTTAAVLLGNSWVDLWKGLERPRLTEI